MTKTITIYTPNIAWHESYSLVAGHLARGFAHAGYHVNLRFAQQGGAAWHESQPYDIQAIANNPYIPSQVGIYLGYPTEYDYFSQSNGVVDETRIALTMFESTILPRGWTDVLNTCYTVITPSTWCARVFAENGVTVPIEVVPLGVNEVYQYVERSPVRNMPQEGDNSRPWLGQKPLTFITVADRGIRKGFNTSYVGFIRAMVEEWNAVTERLAESDLGLRQDQLDAIRRLGYIDGQLILKSTSLDERVRLNNPNMGIINERITDQQMAELYQMCDVGLVPACGEGFGLIGREMAATGMIVLATNFSGQEDDIDQWATPINDFHMVDAWGDVPYLQGCGQWAEVQLESFAAQIREVLAMSLEERNALGKQRSEAVHRLYNWDRFGQQCVEIVEAATP